MDATELLAFRLERCRDAVIGDIWVTVSGVVCIHDGVQWKTTTELRQDAVRMADSESAGSVNYQELSALAEIYTAKRALRESAAKLAVELLHLDPDAPS